MKARTSAAVRTGCEAVQYSDQMHCARCGVQYDVNDQDPPECAPRPTGSNPPPPFARPTPPACPPRVVLTGRKGPTVLAVDTRLSWPDDTGQYLNNCLGCGGLFQGDKHRRWCRLCDRPRQRGRAAIEALLRSLRK